MSIIETIAKQQSSLSEMHGRCRLATELKVRGVLGTQGAEACRMCQIGSDYSSD